LTIIPGAADGYSKSSHRRDRRYQPCPISQLRIICQLSSFENPRVRFAGRISTSSLNWTTTLALLIQTASARKKSCLRDVRLRKSQGAATARLPAASRSQESVRLPESPGLPGIAPGLAEPELQCTSTAIRSDLTRQGGSRSNPFLNLAGVFSRVKAQTNQVLGFPPYDCANPNGTA